MKLCEKLVKLRRESGMTQEELAAKLYVTRTAVSKWENDKGYPGIDSLKLLSQIYNVSIDELISEEDAECARRTKARRSRIFYWCAAGSLALTAVFAVCLALTSVVWFAIPSVLSALAYVAFAFLSRPTLGGMSRADFLRYVFSRAAALIIVLAVLITTLVKTFSP